MSELKEITAKVISYCEIPEEISETKPRLYEASCDTYILYEVTSVADQAKYSDNFGLDNWIIKEYPELEGKEVFIHIDY